MTEPITNHPLEGKYIIYKYGLQDYADESWALALYQLNKGKMDSIYFLEGGDQMSAIGEHNIEELLDLMVRKKIKTVYTVFDVKDFFGIPWDFVSLHEQDKEPEEIELWEEWKCLYEEDSEYNLLKEKGIEVVFYSELERMARG